MLIYGIPGTDSKSTIYKNNSLSSYSIKTGIVIEEKKNPATGETQYIVLVSSGGKDVPIYCTRMNRFGGVYNYEEYNATTYVDPLGQATDKPYQQRAGDVVFIAHIDGDFTNGVILGGKQHPARKEILEANETPAYISRFNGIEKSITEKGALTYTFNGIGGDQQSLKIPAGTTPIPPPKGNPLTAGANFGFTEEGNWQVSDGDKQSVIIRKDSTVGGDITITSGSTTVLLAGGTTAQAVTIETKGDISLKATKSFSAEGLGCTIKSNKEITIDATKGLILKSAGSELLDLIVQLIDSIAELTISSPVGPCSPIQGAPTWAKVKLLQEKIKLMMG